MHPRPRAALSPAARSAPVPSAALRALGPRAGQLKIGVISDVHADLGGLDRALELLVALGAHRIVCLGDVLEKGPDGDGVVARLDEWCVPVVRGNHEDNALKHAALPPDLRGPGERPLRPETLARVADYPLARRYCWAGRFVQLTHGAPGCNGTYLNIGEPLPKRTRRALRRSGDDAVLVGHTHRPGRIRAGGLWIFNPGSVRRGGRRDSHTCGLLSLPELAFKVFDLYTGEPVEVPTFEQPPPR